ncbi:MAG: DUF4070 domain-containing protein [Gammaproteobacteria bacterium]|nr:DUF4070 domain-containing protein [Gammaproteobacteria bacterium]NBT44845.1 DUF4070 domain-containing protein [Gammaproteobacteria bacterium]NBY23185.1 DUF4070 domain-containing protein [Gammaproteobacteria bacterium]
MKPLKKPLRIVLINPEFNPSFWSMSHSLKIFNRKAMMPTSALTLLAALTPPEHEVILIDEAVEPIDEAIVLSADIVGLTGMIVQRDRMKGIAERIKSLGKFLVVGGPWITVEEHYLDGLADVRFIGEADTTWPQFLEDFQKGCHASVYEQKTRTDLTQLPAQRIDLLKLDRYLQGSIQMSRGCPFLCEFCDIIVTFGRQPRAKTPDQVIEELEAWKKAGMGAVFLVDDNVIGNRKALIPILHRLADWQKKNGYIISLHTEASLNLADDEELLDLFVAANIRTVFVGVETPNPEALMETRKLQNVDTRKQRESLSENASEAYLLERIHRIQSKGIKVTCGLIVGFDADTPIIFEAQRRFLKQSGILHAMVGLLSAIPKTPLYDRLLKEGRLDLKDPPDFGTNVIPAQMTREELSQGFVDLLVEIYQPEAYFDRLDDLYIHRRFYDHAEATRVPNIPRWVQVKYLAISLTFTTWMLMKLLIHSGDWSLRKHYLKRLYRFAKSKPYPMRYLDYVMESVCHHHFYRFSQNMLKGETEIINTY